MAPAYQHVVTAQYPDTVAVQNLGQTRLAACLIQRLLLGRPGQGDRIPALLFTPRNLKRKAPASLVVHPEGKAALADLSRGRPGPLVSNLLDRGHLVLTIDPFLTGEHLTPNGPTKRPTDTVCRIQDILTALAYLADLPRTGTCNLLGLSAAGPWCLLARPLARGVARTAVDADRFPADSDAHWADQLYIPAIRSTGDFQTAAALIAPASLLIHNAGSRFPVRWIRAAYRAASGKSSLLISEKRLNQADLLDWLG
jgi:hypothetical protein